jgi:hypothetical protein
LPADKPIVAALRLPARLTQVSTRYYKVGAADQTFCDPGEAVRAGCARPLRGALCASSADATAAARAGADFLVLLRELPGGELEELCRSVSMPVYARGIPLESAWGLGASGINEITARLC